MEPLKNKTLYSRSGNQFARSLFCKQTEEVSPSLGPTIWIFEDFHELKSTKKVLETILSISCSEIRTQADILRYNDATRGHFLGTVSLFDAAFRLEYARKTLTHTIARLDVSGPRKHIEALIRLGYEHGESVSKTHRYHLSGSELTIRDIGQMIHISFFDDEVDEILVGEVRDTGEVAQFHRVDSVTFYAKESPEIGGIPKEVQKINGTGRLWTFDLDFFEKRDALREMYTDWIGFETGGTSLNVEPISLPDIESFTELLRTAGNQTSIYTAFREPVLRHMEYNSLSSHALIDVPKIGLTSFCYKNHFSITDDVLGTLFVQKRSKKQTMRSLDLLMTLKPGDYIVHQEHGIGRFLEMIEKDVGGTKREYVCIEYANSDRLFVPITELYRITKYLWEEHPIVHALGGTIWKKTLKDTEAEVLKTAEELLDIHARRKLSPWFWFAAFPEEEKAFRDAFSHIHTKDQQNAIEEVFRDMESSSPMDRLLCWDVWFGKTEVAMNAAYKAVLWGKQVAVISPLVVLTLEHFESFSKRFAKMNIRIACLSRLTSSKEVKNILAGLESGEISIVIATHRILGDDVRIRRLWLLIIDEEHRFWVLDKEKIKRLRSGIDILSLSATPIPRSLNLALSGLRSLSILAEPPPSKKPITTQVLKWNESVLRDAILQELWQRGQVIVLHNRVSSLAGTAQELQAIVGSTLKPILLHGQMSGEEIEEALLSFRAQEANCLISTTVIENGVNFLEANTIIIDHADEFWLAQLHQLRGRVGRKDREAHCLLMYRKEVLPEDAKRRLLAIVEHAHLWAGFEIAMRDMEIRGAGEILGIAQSGKSKQTGVSLYLKLLENKIDELQSGKKTTSIDVKIELDIEFVLPDSLFAGDVDKIQFYRSIESIEDIEDLESAEASFIRVHGESEAVRRLFLLLRARIYLARFSVSGVKKVLKDYVFEFSKQDTPIIRAFLEIDRAGDFLVQSLERVRVSQKLYTSDLDFLTKLVYSLEHAE